jgi:anti-sigma regulatory factor (Ser/Thr protein kinase)
MMGYVFMRFGTEFRPENVDRLRLKVGECLERAGIFGSTAFVLLNLMDELICNILEHAQAGWVELEVHPLQEEVRLIFRDDGSPFDAAESMQAIGPEKAAGNDSGRSLGLYMVKKIAKSWNYEYLEGSVNELKLTVDMVALAGGRK